MAVSTTTAFATAAGNGVTTAFSTNFYFLSNAHLVVKETVNATGVSTTKTITTHYTVTGALNPVGGTVTMVTAPATGVTLTIERVVPQTQASRYLNDDTFDVTNIEEDFDSMVMLVQDLQRKIDLCLKWPSTETTSGTIGSIVTRASTLLGFDGSGVLTYLATADSSASAAAASAASALASQSSATASAAAAVISAAAAAAVGNGVLTTKGDAVYFSTVAARVAVGANDTILFADSTATPGVAYKTIDLSTSRVVGVNTVAKGGTGLSAVGTAGQYLRTNSAANAMEFSSDNNIVIVEYQLANTTVGGTAVNITWTTYPLNTEVHDPASLASLASNQITLVAGTYRVFAGVCTRTMGASKIRLRNITDGATLVLGTSVLNAASSDDGGTVFISGRFTISGTKVIELQYYASGVTVQTVNLGTPVSSGELEIYGNVTLVKE